MKNLILNETTDTYGVAFGDTWHPTPSEALLDAFLYKGIERDYSGLARTALLDANGNPLIAKTTILCYLVSHFSEFLSVIFSADEQEIVETIEMVSLAPIADRICDFLLSPAQTKI